jgi:hypothetical protein
MRGVAVGEINGDEETCVGVDTQNRPRSSMRRSAPESCRLPKIFERRSAKFGQSPSVTLERSGTIRAITSCRSRSSTVLPARSQALRRRVSRNSRIFTEGIKHCVTKCATKQMFLVEGGDLRGENTALVTEVTLAAPNHVLASICRFVFSNFQTESCLDAENSHISSGGNARDTRTA